MYEKSVKLSATNVHFFTTPLVYMIFFCLKKDVNKVYIFFYWEKGCI